MKPKVSKTPLFWFHLKIHGFMNCFYGFKEVAAPCCQIIVLLLLLLRLLDYSHVNRFTGI